MASPTLLTGAVTHLERITSTTGSMQNGNGQIRTDHVTTFRLDNRPVRFNGVPDLGANENATAAGYARNGIFDALAVRNESTGLVYGHSGMALMVAGVILGLLGFFTLSVLIGWVILPMGAWLGLKGYRQREARALLLAGRRSGMQRSVA